MNAPTSRSTAAKKTTATPAKKTAAAPKRATTTARKITAKKAAPRKARRSKVNLVKPAVMQCHREHRTLHPDFSDAEVYEARAALAATTAGIHLPTSAWKVSVGGGAQQLLPGGIILRHLGRHGDPFTVSVPCVFAVHHVFDDIRTAADLDAAIRTATTCAEPHSANTLTNAAFGTGDTADTDATLTIPLQQAIPATEDTAPQDGES